MSDSSYAVAAVIAEYVEEALREKRRRELSEKGNSIGSRNFAIDSIENGAFDVRRKTSTMPWIVNKSLAAVYVT